MIGKITLATALLVGTATFAQTPNNPNSPANPPGTQMPNTQSQQGQCWDMATNQVRDRGTVGAGNQAGGARPNSPPNTPTIPGSAANRPAGMANC
jgi:hypothetical protein